MRSKSINSLEDLRREKKKLAIELGLHEESTKKSVGLLTKSLKNKIKNGLMIAGAAWIVKNQFMPKAKNIGAQIQSSNSPNELMLLVIELSRKYLKI